MTFVVRIMCRHSEGWEDPPTRVITFLREPEEQVWSTTLSQVQSVPTDLRDEDWPVNASREWLTEQMARPVPKRGRHPIGCAVCGLAEGTWVNEETVRPYLDALAQAGGQTMTLRDLVRRTGSR